MKIFFDAPFPCNVLEIASSVKIKHSWLFDTVLYDPSLEDLLAAKGDVLLVQPSFSIMDLLVNHILKRQLHAISYTLAVADRGHSVYRLFKHFHIVRAAGGIVHKPETNEVLLIYRKGRWDIPKGKSESSENKVFTAKREVEEECNIKVQCRNKISTTYHVLPMRSGQFRLKRTTWFAMELLDDKNMRPQLEEGIEEVKWFTVDQAMQHLSDSYLLVQHVLYRWLLNQAP